MKSFLFLSFKTFKNRIISLKDKPALLILYILLIGLTAFSLISAGLSPTVVTPETQNTLTDIGWLKLIYLGFTLLYVVTNLQVATSTGSTIFDMPDVNFLFVSPLRAKSILVYALLRQSVRNLFASVFIILNASNLSRFWGINLKSLMIIFIGFSLTLIIIQLYSIIIFIYTSGRQVARTMVVCICALMLVPIFVAVLTTFLDGSSLNEAVLEVMNNNLLLLLPVAGWSTVSVFAFIEGNIALGALATALNLSVTGAALIVITTAKADYYEDVLVATETNFQRQVAAKEGNFSQIDTLSARKVKLQKSANATIWGKGASAFLSKHILENFRRNPLKIFNSTSFVLLITSIIVAFSNRSSPAVAIISVIVTLMLMQMFLVGNGLGLKELYSHYIFLVPASSFSKIVFSNLEIVAKSLCENIIIFIICGIIVKSNPLIILMCILVSTCFTAFLVSVNILSMRIFKDVVSQGLLLSFYMLFVVLSMVPGAIAAIFVGASFGIAAALAVFLLWIIILSALFFYLSRTILENCDMATMAKPTK